MNALPDIEVFADYMDGERAHVHRVGVSVVQHEGAAALRLAMPDGETFIFWPAESLRSLPDQADQNRLIVGRAGDTNTARVVIRDKGVADQLRERCPHISRVENTPHLWRRLGILSAAAITSVSLIIFVLVPVMADQLATLLPPAGEEALGDATFEQIRFALSENDESRIRICDNTRGTAALEKMVTRLESHTEIPYNLKTYVLNHEMVNAFALPGGYVIVFRGLLDSAKNAEEVASVLGHEIGHVVHRDATRLTLRSAGSVGVLGLLFGDFAGGAAVLFLAERLIQASYSREAEAVADVFSHDLFASAGLPASRMGDFFETIAEEKGEAEGLRSHLAGHPDLMGRADAARAADVIGDAAFDPVLSPREWRDLQNICG